MIESNPQLPTPELLQIEIDQLHHEIKQVTHMNTLNRSVIQMLTESKSGNHPLFYSVITHLLQQIEMQGARIRRLMSQKNQMGGQMYLLERMSSQVNISEKMHYQLMQEDIERLNVELTAKNNRLMEYEEKIGEIDYLVGFATKTINIFDLNEQTIRFNEEVKQLNKLIKYKQEETEKLLKENEALLKVNMALKTELQKKKDQIVKFKENQVDISYMEQSKIDSSRLNITLPQHHSHLLTSRSILPKHETSFAFLRFQKQLVEDESDSDFDPDNLCPELSIIFKDKVEKIKKKKQQVIPGLNMERVRIIMKKNRNKMDQQERSNNAVAHVNPTQKIIDLEVELAYTTKELSKCMLKEKELTTKYEKAVRLLTQLQARNQLLLKSNQRIKDNWRLLWKQFSFNSRLVKFCQEVVGRELVKVANEGINDLEGIEEKIKNAIDSIEGIQLHQPRQVNRIIEIIEKIRESRHRTCRLQRSNSEKKYEGVASL